MRELVLDSVTACTSSDVLRSMPLLEVLDLSARHPATNWRLVVQTFDAYVDYRDHFYEAVLDLPHLRVLGARDIGLFGEFRSPTVQVIHMSLCSFVRSVTSGFSLANVPSLQSIVVDGAFACDGMDHIRAPLIEVLRRADALTCILKTSPYDNVPYMSTFWLRVAQSLPRVTFDVQ
jgi:hypothetical protein